MGSKVKDRIGIRYNHLVVIEFAGWTWDNRTLWLCKCDCGKEKVTVGSHLQSGGTKSCGCLNREIRAIKYTGKNNHRYTDGKTTKEIHKLKEKIRKRDNYTCQDCGTTQEELGRKLDVHHIDGDDTNNIEENMIALCTSCHQKQKLGVINERTRFSEKN